MGKLRAAICGLGNIAFEFDYRKKQKICLSHAGAFLRNKEVELIGGFDPDPEKSSLFKKTLGLKNYESFEELIAQNADIVSICSPAPLHFKQLLYCMEKGIKMIWLEKPPAINLKEMDILIEAEKKGKSCILVNYQRRYTKSFKSLKQYIQTEKMGALKCIRATYSRGLEENGSHILDIIFFLMQDSKKPEKLQVFKKGKNPSFNFYLNEVEVNITGMDLSYHNIDVECNCEKGRFSIKQGGMTCLLEVKKEHEFFPGFFRLKDQKKAGFTKLGGFNGAMENALEDLILSYKNKRTPLSSLVSSRQSMALMEEVKL